MVCIIIIGAVIIVEVGWYNICMYLLKLLICHQHQFVYPQDLQKKGLNYHNYYLVRGIHVKKTIFTQNHTDNNNIDGQKLCKRFRKIVDTFRS